MTPRMKHLIHVFAKAFFDGVDPFNHDFLVKQGVNSAELVALKEFMGSILMMYLKQSGGIPHETA